MHTQLSNDIYFFYVWNYVGYNTDIFNNEFIVAFLRLKICASMKNIIRFALFNEFSYAVCYTNWWWNKGFHS